MEIKTILLSVIALVIGMIIGTTLCGSGGSNTATEEVSMAREKTPENLRVVCMSGDICQVCNMHGVCWMQSKDSIQSQFPHIK